MAVKEHWSEASWTSSKFWVDKSKLIQPGLIGFKSLVSELSQSTQILTLNQCLLIVCVHKKARCLPQTDNNLQHGKKQVRILGWRASNYFVEIWGIWIYTNHKKQHSCGCQSLGKFLAEHYRLCKCISLLL